MLQPTRSSSDRDSDGMDLVKISVEDRSASSSGDDDDEDVNGGKAVVVVEEEEEEEERRYRDLTRQIPDLPPLRYDDATRRHYLPGLTCPRCHASTTRESLERFAERERQMVICRREGKVHFQDRGGDGCNGR